MSDSIRKRKRRKPKTLPVFPHKTGRWAKKVRGRFVYFGKVADDPSGIKARDLWLEQRDDLLAGRKPRTSGERGLTIANACNLYLDHVNEKVARGERSPRWFEDVSRTLKVMLSVVGRNWNAESIGPQDFQLVVKRFWRTHKSKSARVSPITVRNNIHRVKGMFNWLVKAGCLERLPAYGTAFDPPDKAVVDRHRDNQHARYFTRQQVRALLRVTKDKPRMHAAILLAINTGCQNEDIATLQVKHVDLDGGWYAQPRSKKAKRRRAKLWRRTVKALKAIMVGRDVSPDDLVFLTKDGNAWHGRNCLAKEFGRAKRDAGIDIDRAGFQWLRHSFITEASQTGDMLAVQLACGHADRSITQNYIHRVYDPRLVAIANAVDHWLAGKGGAE